MNLNDETIPRLYSLEEVAELTGMALRTLQKECRLGRITHIKYGRLRAMTAAQIEMLIEKHTKQPAVSADPLEAARARATRLAAKRAARTA